MGNTTLISIITVSYNSEKTIRNTIESVLNQTYDNIEYIIIDGRSNDRTVDIIKEYDTRFKDRGYTYKWISEVDNGIYDAMNKGIKICKGDLIGIINSDDHYELDAISNIVSAYKENLDYDVYHGMLKYYNGKILHMIRGCNCEVLNEHMIEHPACFIKKNTYEEFGVFDCKYKYAADYDLLCRFKLADRKFFMVEKIIANFYDGGAGNCSESRYEALDIRRKYNFLGKKMFIVKKIMLIVKEKLKGTK